MRLKISSRTRIVWLGCLALTPLLNGHAIWNGTAVSNEYPEVFYLDLAVKSQSGGAAGFGCTGTLVHPKLILTAGHCTIKEKDETLVVNYAVNGSRKGVNQWIVDYDKTAPENGMAIKNDQFEKSAFHPSYNGRGSGTPYDIGYIVLKDEIKTITPATIFIAPSKKKDLKALIGRDIQAIGYGLPDPNATYTNPNWYEKQRGLNQLEAEYDEGIFHSKGWDQSVLEGDSGGPIFFGKNSTSPRAIVGIISGTNDYDDVPAPKVVTDFVFLRPDLLCWVEKDSGIKITNLNCR